MSFWGFFSLFCKYANVVFMCTLGLVYIHKWYPACVSVSVTSLKVVLTLVVVLQVLRQKAWPQQFGQVEKQKPS